MQGPQGIQGEKGDPGDAGDLSGYVTTSVYDADMANKVDRPIVYTDGNVASFDSTGNIQDTGISQTNLVSMDQLGIMAFHDGLADGSVTKEMLSPNVQYTLDNALSADGVPPDGDYVPVMNGNQMMWYKIAYPEE